MKLYGLFTHFEERLFERYGLRVNFKEYKDLRHNPVTFLKRQKNWHGQWSTIGLMTIQDQEVLIVQANRGKFLVTALPEYNKIQYPKYLELVKDRQMITDNDLVRISRKPEGLLTRREKRKLQRALDAKAKGNFFTKGNHRQYLKKAVENDTKIQEFNKLVVENMVPNTPGNRKMGLYIAFAIIIAIILFMILSSVL